VISRPLATRFVASFCGALITLVIWAIASAALPSTVGGFVALLGVPVVIYAAVRGFRIELTADRDELVVRNYFRTHRVRWEDVESIGVGFHQMGGVLGDAVAVSRKDRRLIVAAQATMASSRERRRVLNALKRLRPDLPIRFSD